MTLEIAYPPEAGYVYHLVPANLRGSVLYPLSQLRSIYPDTAAAHAAKYHGREQAMEQWIQPLACRWNEVLQLSPVHPSVLRAALAESGHVRPLRRWFAIDAQHFSPSNTALYLPSSRPNYERIIAYTPGCLNQYRSLPEEQLSFYRQVPPGSPLMLFGGIPHILYRGSLDIAGVPVFEA